MVAVNPARFGPRQAQPLEDSMASAKGVLEGLFAKQDQQLPALAQAAIEANARIRALAARLFAPGGEGEELLEALCDVTLRRPLFVTQLGIDPMQAFAFGAFREGQAATVYLLLAWIAEGRSEQQPQREGESHVHSKAKPRRRRDDRAPDDVGVGTAPAAGAGNRRRKRRRRSA